MASPNYFDAKPERFNGKIPFILSDLINEMKKRNVEKKEGIFRLNGSDTQCRELIECFNKTNNVDLSIYQDINTLSTVLKRYFGKMSDTNSLIPNDLYDPIMGLMANPNLTEEQQIEELKKFLLSGMQLPRLKILKYLCQFLAFIESNKAENQMTFKNLSICISPNLLVSKHPSQGAIKQSNYVINAVTLIFQHYETILESVPLSDDDIMTDAFSLPKYNISDLEHLVARCKARENSLIPYVPVCRFSRNKKYKRPTKEPRFAD